MKRGRKIFLTLITLILVAGVAAVGLYELGDKILDSAFDSYAADIENALEQTQEEPPPKDASSPSIGVIEPKQKKSENTNAAAQQPTNTEVKQYTIPIPITKPKSQVNDQFPTTQQPTGSSNTETQITKDKIEDIKSAVTPNDKMAAATLVLSKLSQSDINRLKKLAAGGITPEEKAEIKAIVYSKFTQEEIEKIKAMYIKYMSK